MLGLIALAGLGCMTMNPPRRKKRRRNPYGGPEQNDIATVRITKPKGRRNPSRERPSFQEAKNQYVNRFTMDHTPRWALEQRSDGTYYAPQFRSDEEWYQNTTFPGEPGHMGGRNHCYTSGQTWPLGKALTKRYGSNPKKRKGKKRSGGVSPGGAASRLAHWRWHHNPVHEIHRGDTVTIRTPHGGKFTGKAYLLGTYGWVLGAGPHGARTAIAHAENIIDVRKRRK